MATKKPTPNSNSAAEPEVLVQIRTLTPVRHDGQDFAEARVFEINSSAADELVAAGLAEFVRADPAELSLA